MGLLFRISSLLGVRCSVMVVVGVMARLRVLGVVMTRVFWMGWRLMMGTGIFWVVEWWFGSCGYLVVDCDCVG